MTNQSELRILRNRERRERELRNHMTLLAIVLFAILSVCIFLTASFLTHATSRSEAMEYKYYHNMTVGLNDSLEDVASLYMSADHYENTDQYIAEVMNINHLEDGEVLPGTHLIVPYYSEAIK